MIRVPEKIEDIILWEDKWISPPPFEPSTTFDDRVDEIRLQRLKGKAVKSKAVWEMEKINLLPDEILIRKEDALKLIKPIASLLKIHIKTVKELPAIKEFHRGMAEFMRK